MLQPVECAKVNNSNLVAPTVSADQKSNTMNTEEVVFFVEYRKWIFSTIYNALWRWQYRARRDLWRKLRRAFKSNRQIATL